VQHDGIARENIRKFRIAAHDTSNKLRNLSGGKSAKSGACQMAVAGFGYFDVDEPTHGVDVGANLKFMNAATAGANGKAILLISSDMPELLMLSDTIYVLYKGTITKKFRRDEATEEKIMHYAAGVE
jgi:ABC-type sugar transport system ATPase subunit